MTTPKIVKIYAEIYRNVIKNEKELIQRTKQMIEADKVIKTNFCEPKKEYNDEIKQRFRRQRASIELRSIAR